MNSFFVVEIDNVSFNDLCSNKNIVLPIEQSLVWDGFSASCGNNLWKRLLVKKGDEPVAVVSLYEYHMPGFKYLWAKNGPVYLGDFVSYEHDICVALRDFVRNCDSKFVFLRLNVNNDYDFTRPTIRVIPYDHTVILDLSGCDEDILSRMKPRGRRDVRKGLRNSNMECFEESDTILDNFDEVYQIMLETASRDGFVSHDAAFYKKMIKHLGNNCKFFVGRIDGKAVCWSITTVYNGVAVQYYAATDRQARRQNCYDHLVYFTACYLGNLGVHSFDLMGIGSDFSPSLLGLNEFKTKFTKEVVKVAPTRDVICNYRLYFVMTKAYAIKRFLRKLLRK